MFADNKRTCRVLGQPGEPFRILLMSLPPHGKQISPDKNVNFPCIPPRRDRIYPAP